MHLNQCLSLIQFTSTEGFVVCKAGCGHLVALFLSYQTLVWIWRQFLAVPSFQLRGGPADGWALISSRQTCHRKHLPITSTETSPFSRDLLIATEGGRGGRGTKNNRILPHFLQREPADCLRCELNVFHRPAANWHQ